MSKLQKTKLLLLVFIVAAAFSLASKAPTSAASLRLVIPVVAEEAPPPAPSCGSAEESERDRNCLEPDCKPAEDGGELNKENCGIVKWAVMATRALSALVGVIVVIMVVVGGIQYSASRDNPQATAAAKGRIVNALFALLIYLFMFSFLQWAVPGGIF